MTRDEAIKCVEFHADELEKRGYEDIHVRQALERLKEPMTLAEFLGWEEGTEYEEVYGNRFIIEDNSLYKTYDTSFDNGYKTRRSTGFDWSVENIEWLRQAKKVEYHKEEPKYYAKIKGGKFLEPNHQYFRWHKKLEKITIGNNIRCAGNKDILDHYMTKSEWNKLGIDDSNAAFEEIEGN